MIYVRLLLETTEFCCVIIKAIYVISCLHCLQLDTGESPAYMYCNCTSVPLINLRRYEVAKPDLKAQNTFTVEKVASKSAYRQIEIRKALCGEHESHATTLPQ